MWGFEGLSFNDKRGRREREKICNSASRRLSCTVWKLQDLPLQRPIRCILSKDRKDFLRIYHWHNFIRCFFKESPVTHLQYAKSRSFAFHPPRQKYKIENYLSTFSAAVIRPIRVSVWKHIFFLDRRIFERVLSPIPRKGHVRYDGKEKRWGVFVRAFLAWRRSSTSPNRYRFIRRVPFRLSSFERDCTLASLIPLFFLRSCLCRLRHAREFNSILELGRQMRLSRVESETFHLARFDSYIFSFFSFISFSEESRRDAAFHSSRF